MVISCSSGVFSRANKYAQWKRIAVMYYGKNCLRNFLLCTKVTGSIRVNCQRRLVGSVQFERLIILRACFCSRVILPMLLELILETEWGKNGTTMCVEVVLGQQDSTFIRRTNSAPVLTQHITHEISVGKNAGNGITTLRRKTSRVPALTLKCYKRETAS